MVTHLCQAKPFFVLSPAKSFETSSHIRVKTRQAWNEDTGIVAKKIKLPGILYDFAPEEYY
jgi:hypothetical protein